jgi:hypothetical protein
MTEPEHRFLPCDRAEIYRVQKLRSCMTSRVFGLVGRPPGVCSAAIRQRAIGGITVSCATCDVTIALVRESGHRRYLDTAVTGLRVKELRLPRREGN